MQTPSHNTPYSRWRLRIVTFLVAALATASASYWVLKWNASASLQPTAAVVFSDAGPAEPRVIARVLGGAQRGAAALPGVPLDNAASRSKLTGVVAGRDNTGYAVIAVDGQPAKPYRVGALVQDGLVLHSVAPRSAALAARVDAPVSLTLELPKLSPP
jgi:general secretion pathway protein C